MLANILFFMVIISGLATLGMLLIGLVAIGASKPTAFVVSFVAAWAACSRRCSASVSPLRFLPSSESSSMPALRR